MVQVSRIPQSDGGDDQIEGHRIEILIQLGAVTDGAAAIEADGSLQGVMSLSFIEPNRDTPTQCGILQPLQREQRPLHAAYLTDRHKQVILSRMAGELADQ